MTPEPGCHATSGARGESEDRLEDRVLVEHARARSVDAFETLVSRNRSKVYGLALRMLKDPGAAEEVLQETFLSAWQNLPTFRGESAIGSWLFRICANFCLMRLRRKKLEAVEAPESEQPLAGPLFDSEGTLMNRLSYDWTRGTEEKALDNELRHAIEVATATLPNEHRAVFLLKDIEGLSYEEIAETTRSSVPAVKSRLHRARLALREAIDAFYREPERLRATA